MNLITGQTASLVEEPPTVDLATATDFLRTRYGIAAELQTLRSERDLNFLAIADGRQFVLKVSNSGDDPAQIEMESAAMRHVAQVDPELPIPRIVDTVDGVRTVTLRAADGRWHQVRVMTVMPGAVGDLTELPESFAADFGDVCARLARAMQGFIHPAADRRLEWDPRLVTALRPYAQHLPDTARREPMEKLLDRFEGLAAATRKLPAFVAHGDLTLSNVLIDAGRISGVIDFGDMHHTARVCDLAISLTSLLRESADPWPAASAFLDTYQRVLPLEPEE
ncbi:MAG TPA: phosphotransferase, partial [Kribbella sp.]|nr:phosphotransferase [Kribbella sp.]